MKNAPCSGKYMYQTLSAIASPTRAGKTGATRSRSPGRGKSRRAATAAKSRPPSPGPILAAVVGLAVIVATVFAITRSDPFVTPLPPQQVFEATEAGTAALYSGIGNFEGAQVLNVYEVPAPGAVALFGLGGLAVRRRH